MQDYYENFDTYSAPEGINLKEEMNKVAGEIYTETYAVQQELLVYYIDSAQIAARYADLAIDEILNKTQNTDGNQSPKDKHFHRR